MCEQTKLSITEEEVATTEAATCNQTKKISLFNQEADRITASVMKSICVSDTRNLVQSLIHLCYPDRN